MKTEPKETQTFVSASGNLLSGSLSLSLSLCVAGRLETEKESARGKMEKKGLFSYLPPPVSFFFFNIANFSGILNRVKKSALIFRIEDQITQKRLIVS